MTIQAQTELSNGEQFRNIIVATRNGRPVRLGDLAVVTDSVQDNQTASWYNGTRAILLGVYRQPEANTVEVVNRVRALLPSFDEQLPRATTLHVLNDRSISIRDAVHDVQLTLLLTIGLVIMVIFLFLRRVTATIIPALAVPISLIATLGAMYLLNFSIDNISLLGLTLAVGLVVDDAIVMLENIYRHMEEEGLAPFEAALKGSREIGFTIMSITVSLVAVFIPVLLMGGIIGRIFNEFAVVVTVAIVASAFVSLTLTPMLAAKILRTPEKDEKQARWSVLFERGFDATLRGYDRSLKYCLRRLPMMLVVFFVTLLRTVWLVIATPKGFFPQEDIGQLSVSTEARQDISFAGDGRPAAAGRGRISGARPTWPTSPRSSARQEEAQASTTAACSSSSNPATSALPCRRCSPTCAATLLAFRASTPTRSPVQNLRIGGRSSRAEYQFVMQGLNRATALRVVAEDGGRDGPRSALSPTSTATCRSTPRRRP